MKTNTTIVGKVAPFLTFAMLAALGTIGSAEPVLRPLEAPPISDFSLVGTWYCGPRTMCGAASGLTFKADGTYTHWISLGLKEEGTYAYADGVLKRNATSCTFRGNRFSLSDKPLEAPIKWIDAKHFQWGTAKDVPTFVRQ